jgi:hypothetical protein
MHIVLRNHRRQLLFAVEVDPSSPPTIVQPPNGEGFAVHLDWDRALDDEHHLRRCPVCGCAHLFAQKAVPQAAGLTIIGVAAVTALALYFAGLVWTGALVFAAGAAVYGALYVFARRELVCYRCHSVYHDMPIRRDHPRWQRALSERYRPSKSTAPPPDDTDDDAPDDPQHAPDPQRSDEPSRSGAEVR